LPQLDEFFKLNLGVQFSLSLHAAIDAKRSQLMPVNRRYPLSQIIKTIKRNYHRHKNPVTFEYLLIKDFNGYAEDARALFKIMQGVKCHLNIIPYNHSPYFKWQSPTEAQIKYFKQQLVLNNISFTLRRPRGRDINAACGQLTITANHGT
jgi:23S rRNA (adenine2503-C2)-methyltransferase